MKWKRWLSLGILGLATTLPSAGTAFTIDQNFHRFSDTGIDVGRSLTEAPRWDANPQGLFGSTLADGIQVVFRDDFAASFGLDAAGTQAVWNGAFRAFAAWEQPHFGFDLTIGSGPGEIVVQAVSETSSIFQGNFFQAYSGFAPAWSDQRMLTNGLSVPGFAILGSTISFAIERQGFTPNWALFSVEEAIFELMLHEIGHSIGLDHPSDFPYANFDTDADATTLMPDGLSPPYASVGIAPVEYRSIMSSLGLALTADDLSGFRVLYPTFVPEPSIAMLMALSALGFRPGRRRDNR